MNMMSDNRAISGTACDTASEMPIMPTIGGFIHETLEMQAETFALISNIAKIMWGDEITAPAFTPKENIMAGLAAIQENQKGIVTAVKAIVAKL